MNVGYEGVLSLRVEEDGQVVGGVSQRRMATFGTEMCRVVWRSMRGTIQSWRVRYNTDTATLGRQNEPQIEHLGLCAAGEIAVARNFDDYDAVTSFVAESRP